MFIGEHFPKINLETNGLAFKFICMVFKKKNPAEEDRVMK